MPNIPYVVYGETSPAKNSYPIIIHNTTTNEKLTGLTEPDGTYIFDLANMGSYTVGNEYTVYISYNGYFGEVSFTLSGEGGVQQDMTTYGGIDISTLRTNLWDAIYRKLQTGTYAISTDNIHSAMNSKQVSTEGYPQVIIYIPAIETSALDFNKELLRKEINFMIEVYDKSAANLKVLVDEIEDKFWSAEKNEIWSNFNLMNLDMPDNDYDWWTDAGKKIHKATLNANFTYVGRR